MYIQAFRHQQQFAIFQTFCLIKKKQSFWKKSKKVRAIKMDECGRQEQARLELSIGRKRESNGGVFARGQVNVYMTFKLCFSGFLTFIGALCPFKTHFHQAIKRILCE
jgi:hypothetical protein